MKTVHLLPLTLLATFSLAHAAGTQTINLKMSEMMFTPMNLTMKAGQKVVINVSNVGKVEHELQMYATPNVAPKGEAAWDAFMAKNTIWLGSKDVKLTVDGKAAKPGFFEVALLPGHKGVLSFTPKNKGTYEIACHFPGHYEGGMKGVLTVK